MLDSGSVTVTVNCSSHACTAWLGHKQLRHPGGWIRGGIREVLLKPMDFNLILTELQQASMFDLFRLQAAIGRLLDDPERLIAVKLALRPGMEITYFDEQRNRLVPARILKIRKTRAVIQDLETGKGWTIPLYMINIENQNTDIDTKPQSVDRLSLKVGDTVGFTGKDDEELFGTIIKLNPKRAKIQTENGIWAVPYSMLFTVIDGAPGTGQLIPMDRKPT
jgi:hypothetical protein